MQRRRGAGVRRQEGPRRRGRAHGASRGRTSADRGGHFARWRPCRLYPERAAQAETWTRTASLGPSFGSSIRARAPRGCLWPARSTWAWCAGPPTGARSPSSDKLKSLNLIPVDGGEARKAAELAADISTYSLTESLRVHRVLALVRGRQGFEDSLSRRIGAQRLAEVGRYVHGSRGRLWFALSCLVHRWRSLRFVILLPEHTRLASRPCVPHPELLVTTGVLPAVEAVASRPAESGSPSR